MKDKLLVVLVPVISHVYLRFHLLMKPDVYPLAVIEEKTYKIVLHNSPHM